MEVTEAKKDVRTYWLIRKDELNTLEAWQVMDILRYDGAMVETNGPEGYHLLSSNYTGAPNEDNLKSFGIHVVDTARGEKWEAVDRLRSRLERALKKGAAQGA